MWPHPDVSFKRNDVEASGDNAEKALSIVRHRNVCLTENCGNLFGSWPFKLKLMWVAYVYELRET